MTKDKMKKGILKKMSMTKRKKQSKGINDQKVLPVQYICMLLN